MAKRGTYVGGSTILKPGSDWFGAEPETDLSAEDQKTITFRNQLLNASSSDSSGMSGFDLQRQERLKVKKATWKPGPIPETCPTFVKETKQAPRAMMAKKPVSKLVKG
ncbi:hypothetical protein MCELHM10_03843 [Paracoccaceae bacterium]|jgi:hypothetical protein